MSNETSTITGRLWIARDSDGALYVYDAEPEYYTTKTGFCYVQSSKGDLSYGLPNDFYPDVLPGIIRELN